MIDLEFLNQNTLHRLTITEMNLLAEPTSVHIKPSVSCAEAILICFRASETKPSVSHAEAILVY